MTISGCLGPCDLTNVAAVIAAGGSVWLGGLTTTDEYNELVDWAESSTVAETLLPLPARLARRQFTRFVEGQEPAFPLTDRPATVAV